MNLQLSEILIGALFGVIVSVFANVLYSYVERLSKRMVGTLRIKRTYLRYLSERHRVITSFGLLQGTGKTLSLEEIYTPLIFFPWHRDKSLGINSNAQFTIAEVLGSFGNRLFISGKPGTGKTTLLSYLAFIFATSRSEQVLSTQIQKIPIFVRLRNFTPESERFDEFILDELISDLSGGLRDAAGLLRAFFRRKLRAGECILLMDGLDESFDHRYTLLRRVEEFCELYPDNLAIVTSRHFNSLPNLVPASFYPLEVVGFSPDSVRAFVHRWIYAIRLGYGEIPESRHRADRLANDVVLAIEANEQIAAFASNPLFLSLTVVMHLFRASIPHHRAELYSEYSKLLLGHWDASRGIQTGMTLAQKEYVLERLALAYHRQHKYEATYEEIRPTIVQALVEVKETAENTDRFLDEVRARSGLLVENSTKVFSFSHFVLQEYFVARALVRDTPRESAKFLNEAWLESQSWWHEVILLYAHLLGDTSQLILEILPSQELTENIERLVLAGECLSEAIRVAPEIRCMVTGALTDKYLSGSDEESVQILGILANIKSEDVLTRLIHAVRDTESNVRGRAVYALSKIGLDTQEVREALLDTLHDDNEFNYQGKANIVGEIARQTLLSIYDAAVDSEGS